MRAQQLETCDKVAAEIHISFVRFRIRGTD